MLAKKTKRAVAILMALSLCFGTMGTAAMAVEGTHEHNPINCGTCGGDHQVEVTVTCPACKGEQDVPMVSCEDCDGTGTVYGWNWDTPCPNNGFACNGCDACVSGYAKIPMTCDACGGTGKVIDPSAEVCETCGGKGTIQQLADCTDCTDGTVACTGEFAGEVTQAATCKDTGVMTYTCDACGASYTETIPVDETAHQWGEPVAVEDKAPTCGADGTGIRTCALCGKTEEVAMPATGQHTYGDDLKCTVCGAAEPADEDTAAAIALLEALPAAENVTAADQAAIKDARTAYDALADRQKLFVSEDLVAALTAAESALSAALVAQADALLAAVPENVAGDVWTVLSAYRAVSALSQEQKDQLANTGKLTAVEAYMSGKEVFFYSISGTDFAICAPAGKLTQSNARIRAIRGSMDLDRLAAKLPQGSTLDAAYQMMDYYGIVNTVKALADGQEVVMAFRSELTQSLSKCSVYFVEGTFSSDKASGLIPSQLQNGSLVITLTKDNYTDTRKVAFVAFARSMEYTDGSYTIPSTAANSYVPAEHAASSDGITYGYKVEGNARVITVTIPADYTGDTVNVNMAAIREVFGELSGGFVENGQVVAGGYKDGAAMTGKSPIVPGQTLPYRIEIINLSGQKYTYQSGSLWMDVAELEAYNGYAAATGIYPLFDGGDQMFVVYRTWNKALSALLDTSETLDDATINAALQVIYQNEEAIEVNLPHYYLDYYNFLYNTSAKTLEELPDEAIMDLFDGYRDTVSIVTGQTVYSRETLPELNNLAYNYFYTHGLQLDQSDFWASDYATSAGAVMAGKNTGLDTKAAAAWNSLTGNTDVAAALDLSVTPTFLLGNSYMRYPIACDMGFTLNKVVDYVPSYDYYHVTVNYYDKDTSEKIANSYVSPSQIEGSRYDVTEYDAIAIDGYTYDSTSGDALSGVLNSNKVINVYYVAEETDIDDGDTPTTDLPEDPGETDIDDGDTPTGDLPDLPGEGGEEVDIGEGDVPTGNLPQTGTMADSTMSTIGMLLLALSVTTAGAAAVLWLKKARG